MSPFVIFVLMVACVIALLADVLEPLSNTGLAARGKTNKQIREALEHEAYAHDAQGNQIPGEDGDPKVRYTNIFAKVSSWCVGSCLYYLFIYPVSVFITFVVMPVVAINAIVYRIGNFYLAVGVLAITFISLVTAIVTAINLKKGIALGIKNAKEEKEETFPEPSSYALTHSDGMYDYWKQKREWEEQQKLIKTAVEEAKQKIEDPKVPLTNWGAFTTILRRIFFALPDFYLIYLVVLALMPK